MKNRRFGRSALKTPATILPLVRASAAPSRFYPCTSDPFLYGPSSFWLHDAFLSFVVAIDYAIPFLYIPVLV